MINSGLVPNEEVTRVYEVIHKLILPFGQKGTQQPVFLRDREEYSLHREGIWGKVTIERV